MNYYSKPGSTKELVVLAISVAGVYVLSSYIDAFGAISRWVQKCELINVHGIWISTMVLLIAVSALSLRRCTTLERRIRKHTLELEKEIGERELAEQAVKEGFSQLQTVLDNIPDLIWLKDKDSRFILVNEAFGRACGRKPKALIGRTDLDIWPKDLAEQYRAMDKEVMESGNRSCVYEPLANSDGQTAWIETIKTAARNGAGEVTGTIGIARDVTARKKAEEALRESERKYRDLTDFLPQGIYEIDPRGMVKFANKAFFSMFGYEGSDFDKGLTAADLIVPEERERVKKSIARRMAGENVGEAEYTGQRKDGSRFPLIVFSNRIEKDGEFTSLRGLAVDISEIKRAEEELRETKDLLQALINAAPVGIDLLDRNGNILLWNPAAERIFGWSEQEVIGKFPPMVPPDNQAEYLEFVKDTFEGKAFRSFEVSRKRKDGSAVDISLLSAPVHSASGKVIAVLAIFSDITQQKRASEERRQLEEKLSQAQKIEAIGTLAGGIAHDFNNILAAIFGYIEMALFDLPEKSLLRYNLEQVLKASGRAKDLVKQILVFSRQTQMQENLPIELKPVMQEAVKFLRATLPTTIEIRQNLTARPCTILADPTQIHQVLINLCTNAAHAMGQKGGLIEIGLEETVIGNAERRNLPDLKPGRYVHLTVEDSGCGMDKATMARIFDPYFTTKEVGKGSGLGLAVVHGIVKKHEGAVSVESEPAKGSTFHVFIPAVETRTGESPINDDPLPRGAGCILYVDDEKALVDIGTAMLKSLGYKPRGFTESKEALHIFRSSPNEFDLAITDYTMPDMTGDALARELLLTRPDIPVLLATGFSEMISEEKAKEAGIREFLMKPLSMRDLAEAVKRALEGGRAPSSPEIFQSKD